MLRAPTVLDEMFTESYGDSKSWKLLPEPAPPYFLLQPYHVRCLSAAFEKGFIRQLTCTKISYSYQLILSHANLTWTLWAKTNP